MKTYKIKFLTTVFSIVLCSTLYAQGPPGGQGGRGGRQGGGQQRGGKPDAAKILEMLDTNNDDKIDKEEAAKDRRGKISEDFDEIDANEDGFIDVEELKASLNNRRGERKPRKVSAEKILKEVDQDEDGTLNELEVAAKERRELIDNFNEIDINNDSQLDLEELKTFYSKADKKKKKRRERN